MVRFASLLAVSLLWSSVSALAQSERYAPDNSNPTTKEANAKDGAGKAADPAKDASARKDQPVGKPSDSPTPEKIAELQAKVDQASLAEPIKKEVKAVLDSALKELNARDANEKEAKELEQQGDRREDVKRLKDTLRETLASIPQDEKVNSKLKEAEINAKQKEAKAKLDEARKQATFWDTEQDRRLQEQPKLIKDRAPLVERLDKKRKEIEALKKGLGPNDLPNQSKLILALAQRDQIESAIHLSVVKQKIYEQQAEYVLLKRDEANRAVKPLEKDFQYWQGKVASIRKADAEKKQSSLDEIIASLRDTLQSRDFELLVDEFKRLQQDGKATEAKLADLNLAQREIDAISKLVNQEIGTKIEKTLSRESSTSGSGTILRQYREQLPDLVKYERNTRQRAAEVQGIVDSQSQIQKHINQLEPQDTISTNLLKESAKNIPESDRKDLRSDINRILIEMKLLLTRTQQDKIKLLEATQSIELSEKKLIKDVTQLDELIAERILWVRSTSMFDLSAIKLTIQSFFWLISGNTWLPVYERVRPVLQREVGWAISAMFFWGVLWYFRGKARLHVKNWGVEASKPSNASITPTLLAFGSCLIIGSIAALPVYFSAWRCSAIADEMQSDLLYAVAKGLNAAKYTFLLLGMTREMCRSGSLADAHLNWNSIALRRFRRILRLPALIVVLSMALVEFLDAYKGQDASNSLGRIVFIVSHCFIAWIAHGLLHYRTGILPHTSTGGKDHFWRISRFLLYLIGVAEPLLLSALSFAGYHYTALQLADRLESTLWAGGVLFLVNALIIRWLLMARRKIAIDEYKRRKESKQVTPDTNSATNLRVPTASEVATHLNNINDQNRRLIHTMVIMGFVLCLWVIWSDVLPALKELQTVTLWTFNETVTETAIDKAVDTGGEEVTKTVKKTKSVTLLDLIFALATAGITLVSAKNIPGLLEFSLLQNLPLDSGERYAFTTMVRYVISIVGSAVALASIGVNWSSIQWLVAAMTVGLGFGLQEIFANFISGLILLFERPIRIGDIVTIDGTTGVVSKIRTRATIITDFDRKEMVVPNKDFITGKLVNWTLSDPTLRIFIKVGVAYGTDTDMVIQTLLEVANANTKISREPAPAAYFEDFGESAMNFSLRVFIPHIEHFQVVKHQLYSGIERAFSERKIEFAYQQFDINVRSFAKPILDAVSEMPNEVVKEPLRKGA